MQADARLRALAPWLDHPQAIRAIFFDVGFTLLRPHPSLTEIVRTTCAQAGLNLSLQELRERGAVVEQYFFQAQHVQRGTWADNDAITQAWTEYFGLLLEPFVPDDGGQRARQVAEVVRAFDYHTSWQPYPDVHPALDALRGRYTLGLISDWGIGLGPILRELGLLEYFDFLVVSATSRRAKPDPHLFDLALQRGDALGEYTVYVGDSYVQDILGARGAGINPVLIDRRERLQPAQLDCPVIHSLADLLALLQIP